MTVKKMADIFFGKFTKLLSAKDKKNNIEMVSKKTSLKKSFNSFNVIKKIIFMLIVATIIIAIYLVK